MNVPLDEAGRRLAELVRRVEAGEAVSLTRDGRVVAVLAGPNGPDASATPDEGMTDAEKRRAFMGKYRGRIHIAPDFDELGPEWDEYTKP